MKAASHRRAWHGSLVLSLLLALLAEPASAVGPARFPR